MNSRPRIQERYVCVCFGGGDQGKRFTMKLETGLFCMLAKYPADKGTNREVTGPERGRRKVWVQRSGGEGEGKRGKRALAKMTMMTFHE
jgi:hypothetical protein